MTYFVRIPEKFRRKGNKSQSLFNRFAPRWTFNTEVDAIEFAKSFQSCWVEVSFNNEVIFKNYSNAPKWMSEDEATVVREQNKQLYAVAQKNRYVKKKRDAV